MGTLRKIALGLLSSLLLLVILVGVPLAATTKTLADKDTFVKTLQSKAIYDQLRTAVNDLPLEQAGDPADRKGDKPSKHVFLSATDFSPLVDKYFGYDFYRQAISTVGDSTYQWLAGDTSKLAFEIKITDEPQQFRKDFVDALVARYQKFPVCKTAVAPDLEQLFDKQCRLTSVTAPQIRPVFEQELLNSDLDRFFKKATISSTEFTDNLNSQDSERIRDAYERVRYLQIFVGLAILILSSLVALVVFDRQKSFRVLGRRMLVPSLILLATGLALKIVGGPTVDHLITDAEPGQSGAYAAVVESVIREFVSAISNRWLFYSAVLALISGLLMITQKLINKEAFTLIPTRKRT